MPWAAGEYNINRDTLAYGGYSLGGLAAVYSLFRDDTFANIFSVCGSFWYPGFTEYISSTPVVNGNAYVRLIMVKMRAADMETSSKRHRCGLIMSMSICHIL